MWIHLNLIGIGLLTILIPSIYYDSPYIKIIMSTLLFFAGMYLVTLNFILLFYKETKATLQQENTRLKAEMDILTNEKKILEDQLAEKIKT
jgi:hypothetical protein